MEEYKKFVSSFFKDADPIILEKSINFAFTCLTVIYGIIGIILIISLFKIFKKAGEKPWKALIPIYNYVILYRISGISPIFLLVAVSIFIPKIGLIGYILWNIVDATQKALLVKKFNKSIWFVVGIILFNYIFYPILAFGKSKYETERGINGQEN